MLINEIFSDNSGIEFQRSNPFITRMKVDDHNIFVSFEETSIEKLTSNGTCVSKFGESSLKDRVLLIAFGSQNKEYESDDHIKYSLENFKNPKTKFKVFSAVKMAIEKKLNELSYINYIAFEYKNDDQKRKNLYTKIIKKFSNSTDFCVNNSENYNNVIVKIR